MLRIVLIQPGSTEFDEQRRIKGSLNIPLSANGTSQVERTVEELAAEPIDAIYASECQSALQTAEAVARDRKIRVKSVRKLKNLDHGLWHGKLIDEVKQNQPRIYRQCQDNPDMVCPPEGESMASARQRACSGLAKIMKRHKKGTIALVIPEPMASVVRGLLRDDSLDDFWKAETDCGGWTLIEVQPRQAPVGS
jgi:broad specificity phosphatase PhoE